jgi:hypothetical protein
MTDEIGNSRKTGAECPQKIFRLGLLFRQEGLFFLLGRQTTSKQPASGR